MKSVRRLAKYSGVGPPMKSRRSRANSALRANHIYIYIYISKCTNKNNSDIIRIRIVITMITTI